MRLVARFDKVMVPNVGHDLGTRQDLDVELIFDLLDLLRYLLAWHDLKASCHVLEHCEWSPW